MYGNACEDIILVLELWALNYTGRIKIHVHPNDYSKRSDTVYVTQYLIRLTLRIRICNVPSMFLVYNLIKSVDTE